MITSESVQTKRRRVSWFALTLIFTNVGLLAIVTLALYSFGSIGSAVGYLKGDRLIVDRSLKSFGEVAQGSTRTVTFDFLNASNRGITIIGAKTRCHCIALEGIPLFVPPKSRRPIGIVVKPVLRKGPFQESILLFTNLPTQPTIELSVVGSATENINNQSFRPKGNE